jgi:MFS family permease
MDGTAPELSPALEIYNLMQDQKFFRRNPAFTFLWIARLVSIFGETLATTALVLFLAEKGNGTLVSTLLAVQTLPGLLGPFMGSLIDRVEQRKFMAFCFLGRTLASITILLVLDNLLLLPLLVAAAAFFSTGYSIAGKSILPHVVQEDDFSTANALSGLGLNVALAFGPAAAGAFFELLGVQGLLWGSAGMFALAMVLARRLPQAWPQVDSNRLPGFLQSTWTGMRYMGQFKVARAVSLGLFLTVIFAAYGSVGLVFLVQDVLKASPAKYGLVQSFYGAGMVLAPLLCLHWVNKVSPKYILFSAITLLRVGNLLTGLAPSLLIVIFTLSIAGVGNGLQNLANDTIIQQAIPRQMLGRLFGSVYSGAHLAAALAYAAGGPILDLTSPRFVYVTAGVGVLLALVVTLVLFSSRHLHNPVREPVLQECTVKQVLKG